jgi:hypothetical protein
MEIAVVVTILLLLFFLLFWWAWKDDEARHREHMNALSAPVWFREGNVTDKSYAGWLNEHTPAEWPPEPGPGYDEMREEESA